MTKLIATVSMDKIDSKPVVRFKKGDAFVKMAPHPLLFMEETSWMKPLEIKISVL